MTGRPCEVLGCANAAIVKINVRRLDDTASWNGWVCQAHADDSALVAMHWTLPNSTLGQQWETTKRVTLLTEALTAAQFVLSTHLAHLQADRSRNDPTGEGEEIVGETLAQIDALIGPYEPGKYFRTLQAARDRQDEEHTTGSPLYREERDRWLSECSCGWEQEAATMLEARLAWENHKSAMAHRDLLAAEVEHLREAGTIAPGDERMRLMERVNRAAKAFDLDDEEPIPGPMFCSECGMTLADCCDPPLCCACGDSEHDDE